MKYRNPKYIMDAGIRIKVPDFLCSKAQLIEALPHGSGIDGDWHVDRCSNGTMIAYNSFHKMNENGYYDGWVNFKVRLFRCTKDLFEVFADHLVQYATKGDIDFQVYCSDPDLKSYLGDLIADCLRDAGILIEHGQRTGSDRAALA